MNQAIRLRRRYFNESSYGVLTPSWVSNAWWAVRRSKVLNAAMFANKEAVDAWLFNSTVKEKTDADIEKFWSNPMKPFTVTPILIDGFHGSRVLLAPDDYAVFDNDILELFGVRNGDVLYASDGEKQFCEFPTYERSDFTIMPRRRFADTSLLSAVMEWGAVLKQPQACLAAANAERAVTPAASEA